jgi:hypothetical protein
MKRLEIPSALFAELIMRLRARGINWTTWRIEGKMHVYTGKDHKKAIRKEIRRLQEGEADKEA